MARFMAFGDRCLAPIIALTPNHHKSIFWLLFLFSAQFFKQPILPPSGVKDEKGLLKDDQVKLPKGLGFPFGGASRFDLVESGVPLR